METKEYSYHLFLRNQETGDCKVQTIIVTQQPDEVLDANLLFAKLHDCPEQFDKDYVLIGLNVGLVEIIDPIKPN